MNSKQIFRSLYFMLLALFLSSLDATAAQSSSQEGSVGASGAELHYRVLGEGEPILVVHGGPGLGYGYLLPGMEELVRTHQVIFYDQRGSGRSTTELTESSVNLDSFIADIGVIQDRLGLERVSVLGHSFGGLIAMLYTLENPDRVNSLILMNSVEPGQRYEDETAQNQARKQTDEDRAELDSIFNSPDLGNGELSAFSRVLWLSFKSTFADPEKADQLRIDLSAETAQNFSVVNSLLLEPLRGFDYWDRLDGIGSRTLVLHGAEDPIPSDVARKISEEIPNSELVIVRDSGHFPYIEKPEETFKAIRDFLGRGM